MGCGCLLALVAVVSPRFAFILVWLFTDLVGRALEGFLLPTLGLIFLPFTTLFYVLVYDPAGLTVWSWLLVILGFLFDLAAYGSSGYANSRQSSYS